MNREMIHAIWNGCVQCDGKTLTFEFVERKDTDDKV